MLEISTPLPPVPDREGCHSEVACLPGSCLATAAPKAQGPRRQCVRVFGPGGTPPIQGATSAVWQLLSHLEQQPEGPENRRLRGTQRCPGIGPVDPDQVPHLGRLLPTWATFRKLIMPAWEMIVDARCFQNTPTGERLSRSANPSREPLSLVLSAQRESRGTIPSWC